MNHSISILFFLWAVIFPAFAVRVADETPNFARTLFRFPVSVEAKVVRADPPFIELAVDIVHKRQKFHIDGLIQHSENAQQAIAQQKAQSGWKDNYFFLRDDCAGCNAARGTTDHVFTVRNNELHYLGEVAVEDPEKIGSSLDEGIFSDIYDKFEANELTSHADGPRILIGRRDIFRGRGVSGSRSTTHLGHESGTFPGWATLPCLCYQNAYGRCGLQRRYYPFTCTGIQRGTRGLYPAQKRIDANQGSSEACFMRGPRRAALQTKTQPVR